MPYLASNEDVNKQDSWSKLLLAAGVVASVAAIGGSIAGSKGMKAMQKNYNQGDVVKEVYGKKKAKDIFLSEEAWKHVTPRNFRKNAEGELLDGAARYQAGRSMTGKAKMYRTDGNVFQNAYSNWKDKDLKMFNKELSRLQKGTGVNPESIYSHSKLSLYDHLNHNSKGLNTNTHELAKLTDEVFNSKGLKNIRDNSPLTGMFDENYLTNNVWGAVFDGGGEDVKRSNYVQREKRQSREKKMKEYAEKHKAKSASRKKGGTNPEPTPDVVTPNAPAPSSNPSRPGQLRNKLNSFEDSPKPQQPQKQQSEQAQRKSELLQMGKEQVEKRNVNSPKPQPQEQAKPRPRPPRGGKNGSRQRHSKPTPAPTPIPVPTPAHTPKVTPKSNKKPKPNTPRKYDKRKSTSPGGNT